MSRVWCGRNPIRGGSATRTGRDLSGPTASVESFWEGIEPPPAGPWKGMTMSADVTAAEERFRVWSRLVTAAIFNQMDAAAHMMAERARSLVPAAVTLVLEDSDQGEWLSLVGVEDRDGRLLEVGDDLIEIDGGAAACIHSDTASTVAGVQVRSPGGRHTSVYALTIGRTQMGSGASRSGRGP